MNSKAIAICGLVLTFLSSFPACADELEKPIQTRSKWALIVGVSEFQDPSLNLESAAQNARAFEQYLTTNANFPKEHVKVILNEQATREAILAGLGEYLASANKDDLVVAYLCSRGSSPSLDYQKVTYLLANDSKKQQLYATGVALREIPRILSDRNRSSNLVIIADCDYSGCAVQGRAENDLGLKRVAEQVDSGPIVISSCGADQTSNGSSFTKHFLDGLVKNGEKTKLSDAFTYAKAKVASDALLTEQKQTPLMEPVKPVNDPILAGN